MLSQSPSKKILSKAVLWYSSKKLFIKQYSKEELFHKKLYGNQSSRLFEIVWKIGKVTMNKNKVPI